MPSNTGNVPVVSWPGIFSLRASAADINLADGEMVSSEPMSIFGFGEGALFDFPSDMLPVHSWLLAWSVRTTPLTFIGTADQWHRLRISFIENPGGASPSGEAITRISMLPLTEGIADNVQASGQVRIHSAAAFFTISNNIGQTVTLAWDAWAKAG